ncbi:MAG: hypothetical protein V4501_11880 [Pseudomonadota bacterium]
MVDINSQEKLTNKKENKNKTARLKEKLLLYVRERYWILYRHHTAILSSTCRQLALGEGGICWFIISNQYGFITEFEINTVLVLLVLFFLSDVAQYLLSSEAYKNLASTYDRLIEQGTIKRKSELDPPPGFTTSSRICFVTKLIWLTLASIYLIFLITAKHTC